LSGGRSEFPSWSSRAPDPGRPSRHLSLSSSNARPFRKFGAMGSHRSHRFESICRCCADSRELRVRLRETCCRPWSVNMDRRVRRANVLGIDDGNGHFNCQRWAPLLPIGSAQHSCDSGSRTDAALMAPRHATLPAAARGDAQHTKAVTSRIIRERGTPDNASLWVAFSVDGGVAAVRQPSQGVAAPTARAAARWSQTLCRWLWA